nr:hypothetical protein [Chloroflexia bacterium]
MRRPGKKYVIVRRAMRPGLATLAACSVAALIGGGYAERPESAVIVLGSLVLIAILSPGGALGGVILALPTAYTLHPFPVGSFSLLEVGIMCLAVGVGATVLRSGWRSIQAAWRVWSDQLSITLPAAAIIAAAGVAFATLPRDAERDVALREIRVTLMEPLILFGVALLVMRDPLSRRWAWVCAVTIGAVIGAGASVQVLGGFGGVESGVLTRATGIYSHPNNLALFLERTFLLSLPMLLVRPRDPLLWLAAGLQLAGIALTFSRGAVLAVCVGVGVVLLLLGMRVWLKAGVAVALGAGAVFFAISRERLLDMGGSGSEPTRFAIW